MEMVVLRALCGYRGRIVGRSHGTAGDSWVCMWLCLSRQCDDVAGTLCMLKTEYVTMHVTWLQNVARKILVWSSWF